MLSNGDSCTVASFRPDFSLIEGLRNIKENWPGTKASCTVDSACLS